MRMSLKNKIAELIGFHLKRLERNDYKMTRPYERYLPPYFNDRRRGKERRKFLYSMHIPELRTGKDRRSGLERRKTSRQMINKSEMRDKSSAFDELS